MNLSFHAMYFRSEPSQVHFRGLQDIVPEIHEPVSLNRSVNIANGIEFRRYSARP